MSDKQPPHPPDDNDIVGTQVGQFRVLEEVGRGGMATVYRATQQSINRDVALKVLPRTFLHDPGFFERFAREVEVVSGLEHPHIVPIYDYGEADGMPYIAMRYLAGGSLRRLINREIADLRELVRPVSQVAQALDHAHQSGIIHRDLKPGNILLDNSNNAYLSDFGIARVLNSDLTGSAIIGTPSYMSPEQANGDPLDARSDVYALGIVVFELITGREPFQANTPIAMLLKQINERVPSLTEYRDNIPEAVDKVIAKATEKNPDERYGSAGELADAFTEAVRSMPGAFPLERQPQADDDLPPTEPMPDAAPSSALDQPTVTPPVIPTVNFKQAAAADQPEMDGAKTAFATSEVFERQPARQAFPLWLVGAGVVVILAVAAGFLLARGDAALTEAVPRYADEVQVVTTAGGSVAFAVPAGYEANGNTWASPDGDASVHVRAEVGTLAEVAANYAATADGDPVDAVTLVSGERLRQSYRGQGGQLDVFFSVIEDRVIVAEVFADRDAPPATLAMLEQVLASVRVLPAS